MKIKSLFESKFIKVFDLQYQEGRHYYNATRRDEEDLVAAKSTEEFKKMLPDAVSCVVIWNPSDDDEKSGHEPCLLMNREFRYPTGQYLLSVPAGLIDPEDCTGDNDNTASLIKTAMRELHEETGLKVTMQECYKAIGGNYEAVLGRLHSEALIQRFTLKFLEDQSYLQLKQALENKNYEDAFRSAHTLKGV